MKIKFSSLKKNEVGVEPHLRSVHRTFSISLDEYRLATDPEYKSPVSEAKV